jgi:hypothetical protein
MPVRDQLIGELGGEDDLGVLLVAQMGGGPNEIQLIVETAQYEEAAGGLRQRGGYIIRAINTQEHRLSLGIFGSVFFTDVHPILLHHNEAKREIHFEGVAADVNELVLDIHQTYASTFGPWRELVRDIRRDQPHGQDAGTSRPAGLAGRGGRQTLAPVEIVGNRRLVFRRD